jgi:hypothetical protein
MTILGFTGTQHGMTDAQHRGFINVIDWFVASRGEFHHGDCVGADAEAHAVARVRLWFMYGHPPSNPSKRAFCACDALADPFPYLVRNQAIVDAAEYLIAVPRAPEEHTSQRRSGTWFTVRRARLKGIPVTVVWPDGRIEENSFGRRIAL